MSDGSPLQVEVKVNSEGAVRGLKIVSSSVTDAAELMRSSLAKVATETSAHTEEMSGSLDGVVEHIRGMRSEMRLGNFMALQLSQMGVAAKGTAGELSMMVAAFALGGPMGAAIEAAKILVTTINDLGKEEEKAKEEMKKFGTDAAEAAARVRNEVNKMLMEMNGASKADLFFAEKVLPALKEEADLKAVAMTAQQKLSAAEEKAHAYVIANYHTEAEQSKAMEALTHKETEAVAKANAELKAKQDLIAELNHQNKRVDEGESAEKAKKQAEEDSKTEEQHNLKMLELHAALLSGEEKLEAEYAVKLQQIRDNDKLSAEQKDEEIAAQSQIYIKQVMDFRNAEEKKAEVAHNAWLNRLLDAEAKAAEAIRKLQEHNDQQRGEIARKRGEEEKKQIEEQIRMAEKVGGAFGSAFEGIISGTESVGQAFKNVAKDIIKTMFDVAVKNITSNALIAGSGAAASQAGIPLVGPALAAGAMIAMEGLVLGLISSLPSASGGFDIPSGINPVTQLHAREMVLPAQYADVIRGMAGGDGSGGGETHVHIHALDGASVQRVVESRDFQRAIREARRNGLVP